jgi:hypothetical protein
MPLSTPCFNLKERRPASRQEALEAGKPGGPYEKTSRYRFGSRAEGEARAAVDYKLLTTVGFRT